MTSLPESAADVLLHGLIGVDYILHLSAPHLSNDELPDEQSSTRFALRREIEREERLAGGLLWRLAAALSEQTIRVALNGNSLGDDSNGRLVERENQTRSWLCSPQLQSLETPYWVLLKTPKATTTILSRQQAAQQNDHAQFGEQSSTRFDNWPRTKIICCTDELPFSSLTLAHFARAERIPLWLISTSNAPVDEVSRAALAELSLLANQVVMLHDDSAEEMRNLAMQIQAHLRLTTDS